MPQSPSWSSWLRRHAAYLQFAFSAVLFMLVAMLLARHARTIDWAQVGQSLRSYQGSTLALAAALSATSFLVYSCFDLIGRAYTRHRLSWQRVMTITFVSYAMNMNLGTFVGAVAMRYRLYSRMGIRLRTVATILAVSLATNWLGYCLVAGLAFASGTVAVNPQWSLSGGGLRLIGLALLALIVAYLVACAFSRRRRWTVRGHDIRLPSLRMALVQLVMASTNWLLMAGVIFVLLRGQIGYPTVAGVFLVSVVASVAARIPAGLGVIEAVFLSLLHHAMPDFQLLAALLTYRLIYYLLPLGAALLVFLSLEASQRGKAPPIPRTAGG